MKKLCRFAALAGVLACTLWSATPRLAHAQVYCEQVNRRPCATLGATRVCHWQVPAGAVGICECTQTAEGLRWMCV
jgi:hypothetical protein